MLQLVGNTKPNSVPHLKNVLMLRILSRFVVLEEIAKRFELVSKDHVQDSNCGDITWSIIVPQVVTLPVRSLLDMPAKVERIRLHLLTTFLFFG